MNSILITALLAGAVRAAAHPQPHRVEARATSICGQWDTIPTGVYTVYQDLWNEDAGTGSQCSTVDNLSDDGVLSWSTKWSWSGGSTKVKSYANIVTNFTITTLDSISSIPSLWSWSYSGTDLVADVSYDMFTSSSASGSNEYEIMIWLEAIGGAGPISSTGSSIATATIAGSTWDLYSGANGDTTVFTFVATSAVEDFSGDIKDFLNYLIDNEGLSSSQYLLSIGAGTEPFTGSSAVLSVASYSCAVSTGAASTSAAASTVAATTLASSSAVATTSSSSSSSSSTAAAVSTAAIYSSSAVAPASSSSVAPASTAAPSSPASSASSTSSSSSSAIISVASQVVSSVPISATPISSAPVTTAAPTTAAPTTAEPATTLATSTKKSCHRKRSE